MNYPEHIAQEVWRQMESFAGFSFNKAHSASYAVESYQSLYLKAYYPLEFMVAVINNFGGFYRTRVYVHELKKAGGIVHMPCANQSDEYTTLYGKDVYLGFVHVSKLEKNVAALLLAERRANGPYLGLEDFMLRTNVSLEQLRILIRVNAFDFTGKTKQALLWEAHLLHNKSRSRETVATSLFETERIDWKLPEAVPDEVEQAYDELELLEFVVGCTDFDLLKTTFRGECKAKDLLAHTGKTVRLVGNFIADKQLHTSRREPMAFGTFIDDEGTYFDTVHFSDSLRAYPFRGKGVYLLLGRVTQEFGVPGVTVEKMAKLPIKEDARHV